MTQTSYFNSLYLSFLICTMGLIAVTTSWDGWRIKWVDMRKSLEWCLGRANVIVVSVIFVTLQFLLLLP